MIICQAFGSRRETAAGSTSLFDIHYGAHPGVDTTLEPVHPGGKPRDLDGTAGCHNHGSGCHAGCRGDQWGCSRRATDTVEGRNESSAERYYFGKGVVFAASVPRSHRLSGADRDIPR